VLSVPGGNSDPFFVEGRALLNQRFPQCTDVDIPNASHLLNLQAPQPIANAVARFVSPVSARPSL
jgi:pimeloyl-ACP methyl ester carboxylesterase